MAQTPAPVATAFVDTPQPIVKVMRLYKPTIHVCTPVPELTFLSHAPSVSQEFAFSEMLLLPESFGDIYMGETFCAYVSMVNSSDAALRNVNLNTRLQTSNSNFDLPDVSSELLQRESALDMVVRHPLTSLGTHTLRVTVQYTEPKTLEKRTIRKFYRFNVLSPVTIRCKTVECQQHYYIQCHITNITKSDICIDRVIFIPSAPFSEVRHMCKRHELSSRPIDAFDALSLLAPEECYSCAFAVQKPSLTIETARIVGRAEVSWISAMGERGVLQGDSVAANTHSKSVELRYSHALSPRHVLLGEEFEVTFTVTNHALHDASQLQLQCHTDETSGLIVTGRAFENLPDVAVGDTYTLAIRVFPMTPGLQALQRVTVLDTNTGTEYTSDDASVNCQ